MAGIAGETHALLEELGVDKEAYIRGDLDVRSPITGEIVGSVQTVDVAAANARIEQAHEAFLEWRMIPAPQRGELVRLLGEELRASRETLGRLVTIETGKILSEGIGRGAGDDRHLHLCSGIIASTVRA